MLTDPSLSPPHQQYQSNPNPNNRVKHLKALVDDDHELHDLIHENDEFGWCVYIIYIHYDAV